MRKSNSFSFLFTSLLKKYFIENENSRNRIDRVSFRRAINVRIKKEKGKLGILNSFVSLHFLVEKILYSVNLESLLEKFRKRRFDRGIMGGDGKIFQLVKCQFRFKLRRRSVLSVFREGAPLETDVQVVALNYLIVEIDW